MKLFWLDTETTGLDPSKNCIIQIGYMIEIDGKVIEEGSILSRPFESSEIDPEALRVHGRSVEDINCYQSPTAAHEELANCLSKYVNRFDRADKFVPAGYFVNFDTDMLRSFFRNNSDEFYGAWFTAVNIDVAAFVAWKVAEESLQFKDYKLGTLCNHYCIAIEAHDALADIRATRQLFRRLVNKS